MAIQVDAQTYHEMIAQIEQAIEDNRRQLDCATDPRLKATTQRIRANLEDLLAIYRKTKDTLAEHHQLA